ncbi:MAG: hypothetical protein KJ052_06570 [Candidatus Hydrogenedentes bacterium]|nr:hypothetical protein [Candidatus Hydrogenedentota bacterium]
MKKSKYVPLTVLLVGALVVLLGCPPGALLYSLLVKNRTALSMTDLNVVMSEVDGGVSREWGFDFLANDLAPGKDFTLNEIPQGMYDLRALFRTGNRRVQVTEFDVPFGGDAKQALQVIWLLGSGGGGVIYSNLNF